VNVKYTMNEKVLLHINAQRASQNFDSKSTTSRGVSDAMGITVDHACLVLKGLMDTGLVARRKVKYDWSNRKVGTYRLTPKGAKAVAKLHKAVQRAEKQAVDKPVIDFTAMRRELSEIRNRALYLERQVIQAME
jgi:DNA-binding MarR family transcriptional regulator